MPLITPGRQEADVEPKRVSAVDDPVDMLEVRIVRHQRRAGAGEWFVTVGIGRVDAVQLGERHRLDDGIALIRARAEVLLGLFTIQSMEQLPRGVPEPEKRRAVGLHQAAAVGTDPQRVVGGDK